MSMKFLRIWHWCLYGFIALNLVTLVLGIIAGTGLWWVQVISIAVLIGCIRLNKRTIKQADENHQSDHRPHLL